MISNKQIEELELILGKCVRLCAWIEWQVTNFYAFDKTKDMPLGIYQDKNFNICVDRKAEGKYVKTFEKYENDSFNIALKTLIKEDKNNIYFSKKQYMTLEQIRKLRNEVFHDSMCFYISWKNRDEEVMEEYNIDLKRAKKLLSLATQYKEVVEKRRNAVYLGTKK